MRPPPGVSRVPAQPCSAEHSLAVLRRYMQLLVLCCRAGAALRCCCLAERMHRRARALISSRTGSRTALSAVHFTYPQDGLMCRKCFLRQEAPATKTSLHYLCWCMGPAPGTRLSAQWHERTLSPFSLHFQCTCSFKNALWWLLVAGGAVEGPRAPPPPPNLDPQKWPLNADELTLNTRIVVSYAHWSGQMDAWPNPGQFKLTASCRCLACMRLLPHEGLISRLHPHRPGVVVFSLPFWAVNLTRNQKACGRLCCACTTGLIFSRF